MHEIIQDKILPCVSKPARYIGNELNSVHKDHSNKTTIALCYPDAYEIGMSNLGLSILYNILNSKDYIAAERVFAPMPDMEKQMLDNNIPLFSLESWTEIRKFDAIGFSIQNELTFTNLLNILKLSHIPLFSSERKNEDPIILAGGVCANNPMPLAKNIDAFILGDGEEVVLEIADTINKTNDQRIRTKDGKRNSILEQLAKIECVYVPGRNDFSSIKRRFVEDLNLIDYPTKPIVPFIEVVHDRAAIEIMRGCPRRCRFCQAGQINKPVRLLKPDRIINLVKEIIKNTGYEELSLLSLSSSDYPWILDVAKELEESFAPKKISLSLPSLRADTLNKGIAQKLQSVRKSGITIAPEAGSQRLRDYICKDLSKEDVLSAVRNVFSAGAKSIKLYFMIGLPTETNEDIKELIALTYEILKEAQYINKRAKITLNISTFAPKKGTLFENEEMITLKEIIDKQDFIKNNIRNKKIEIRWHDPMMSRIEGIFSAGGEKTGKILYDAFLSGCRFDNWHEFFNFKKWEEILAAHKIKV